MGEGAFDAGGEVAKVGPERDDVAGEGGVMEEACGDQRGEGREDGGETGEEGRCIHENIPSTKRSERQRKKAEAEARGGGLQPHKR